MRRSWGPSVSWRRLVGCGAGLLIVCGLGLWAPASGTAAVDCSKGRTLLQCSEKVALYNDSFLGAVEGFLNLGLFAPRVPSHLNNPALKAFWEYQTAIELTRYQFEFTIINQNTDPDWEQVAPAAKLPAPVVKPTGIVTRHMARAMRTLLRTEQREVVNLVAMSTALNRATAALIRSRPDWSAWQTYQAAGFASRAAAAIGPVIRNERRVTKAFLRARLQFGVGQVDGHVEQRQVKKHRFPSAVEKDMAALGVTPVLLGYIEAAFLKAHLAPTTYSLSQYLSASPVISAEKACATQLRHFAARIQPVPQPT